MVAFFEALQCEGFGRLCQWRKSPVKRLPYVARFINSHQTIYHTFTSGYNPQANGTAERAIGLIKSLAARALATANLDSSHWSYCVRYASQSLLCHALQMRQRSLPFVEWPRSIGMYTDATGTKKASFFQKLRKLGKSYTQKLRKLRESDSETRKLTFRKLNTPLAQKLMHRC